MRVLIQLFVACKICNFIKQKNLSIVQYNGVCMHMCVCVGVSAYAIFFYVRNNFFSICF